MANGETRQELVHGTNDECERDLLRGSIRRAEPSDTKRRRDHRDNHDEIRPVKRLTSEENAGRT